MTWPGAPVVVRRVHIDVPLLLLLLLLTFYGLVVLYSASGQSAAAVIRQGSYFALGYVIMILAAQISLQRYVRLAPWLYLVGLTTLVAVVFVGVGAKGAQRWLEVGGFRFQPSEIMKLVVPLVVAWFLGWTGSAAGIIFYRRLIDFVGVARHVDRDTARSGYVAVDRRQWSVRSVYGGPSLALYFGCGGACGSIGMAGLDVWA